MPPRSRRLATRRNSPQVALTLEALGALAQVVPTPKAPGVLAASVEANGRRALANRLALGARGEHFQDELGTRPDERRVLVEKPAHVA